MFKSFFVSLLHLVRPRERVEPASPMTYVKPVPTPGRNMEYAAQYAGMTGYENND